MIITKYLFHLSILFFFSSPFLLSTHPHLDRHLLSTTTPTTSSVFLFPTPPFSSPLPPNSPTTSPAKFVNSTSPSPASTSTSPASTIEHAVTTCNPLLDRATHALIVRTTSSTSTLSSTSHPLLYSSSPSNPPSLPSLPSPHLSPASHRTPVPPSPSTFSSPCYAPPFRPNDFTLPSVFKASASLRDPRFGSQVDTLSIKTSLVNDVYVASAAEDMYFKCTLPVQARKLFDEMPHKNIVAWNALMTNVVADSIPSLFSLMVSLSEAQARTVTVVR